MKRQNIRTLALIICTFTYLLVGAAVFDALESEHEISESQLLEDEARILQERFNINETEYQQIAANIIKSMPYRFGTQWKFSGALFFSTTVITTIGIEVQTPSLLVSRVYTLVFLADRTATQYDRLLASSCCPSVCPSVCDAVHCGSRGWCTRLKVAPACS